MGSYKNPDIANQNNIICAHKALQGVEIRYQDFAQINPQRGDFVYFDPPYHPTSENSFVSYVNNGFAIEDQIRLNEFVKKLHKKNVKFMLSNSDTEFINDLYKNFNIKKIKAPRFVNCKSDGRKPVTELLITNY